MPCGPHGLVKCHELERCLLVTSGYHDVRLPVQGHFVGGLGATLGIVADNAGGGSTWLLHKQDFSLWQS